MSPSPILATTEVEVAEAALTACPPFVARAPGLVSQDFSMLSEFSVVPLCVEGFVVPGAGLEPARRFRSRGF
jgi:hypothetical protein